MALPVPRAFGLVLLVCACLNGRAQAEITVRDDRGEVLVWNAPPKRIVSLLPSVTESLCALGACASLVGTDDFSNWPDAVRRLPKLGGLDDAQLERIVQLKPDLVLPHPAHA